MHYFNSIFNKFTIILINLFLLGCDSEKNNHNTSFFEKDSNGLIIYDKLLHYPPNNNDYKIKTRDDYIVKRVGIVNQIYLTNDSIYYNGKSHSPITTLPDDLISNFVKIYNKRLVDTLFDFRCSHDETLKREKFNLFTKNIDSLYNHVRNNHSIKIFNKELSSLDKFERLYISSAIPYNVIFYNKFDSLNIYPYKYPPQ